MLRPGKLFRWPFVILCGFAIGCSSFGIKDGTPFFTKKEQWEPPEEKEDEWASVGKVGRGSRKLEDENDPLKGVLMSKEAQDIERNLGYK